jgi:hypothetical protein
VERLELRGDLTSSRSSGGADSPEDSLLRDRVWKLSFTPGRRDLGEEAVAGSLENFELVEFTPDPR